MRSTAKALAPHLATGKNQPAVRLSLSACISRFDRRHQGHSASCPWKCCSSLQSQSGGIPPVPPSPMASVAPALRLHHATTARRASASRNRPRKRMETSQKARPRSGELFGKPLETAPRGAGVLGVIRGSRYCLQLSCFHALDCRHCNSFSLSPTIILSPLLYIARLASARTCRGHGLMIQQRPIRQMITILVDKNSARHRISTNCRFVVQGPHSFCQRGGVQCLGPIHFHCGFSLHSS